MNTPSLRAVPSPRSAQRGRSPTTVWRQLVLASLTTGVAACGSGAPGNGGDNGDTRSPGDDGAGCSLTSDCDLGEACDGGTCVPECREDRDCPDGQTCHPDAGCLGPDDPLPQAEPVRNVNLDLDDIEVDIAARDCEFDFDCGRQDACTNGECVATSPGDECNWSFDAPMAVGTIVTDPAPRALAHGTPEHIGCWVVGSGPGVERSVVLYRYTEGRLRVTKTALPDVPDDRSAVCKGVQPMDDEFVAVVAAGLDRYTVALDENAELTRSDFRETQLAWNDPATLVPLNSASLLYLTHDEFESSAYRVSPSGGGWISRFSAPGQFPTAAQGADLIFTTRALTGIIIDSFPEVEEEILPGHRGIAIHNRGGTELGWLSAAADGEIFYSIGEIGGPWVTETTGYSDFQFEDLDPAFGLFPVVQLDVGTHPTTGEPLLVYDGYPGTDVRYLTRREGVWLSGATGLGAGLFVLDIKAMWVGCGRPAIEVLSLSGAGWTILEAR